MHPGEFFYTDPIGYEDQLNLDAYVGNDPVNNIDPTEKVCVPCVTGAIGGGLAAISNAFAQIQRNEGVENFNYGKLGSATVTAVSPPDENIEVRNQRGRIDRLMIDRFKRAIRYRKWAILLFPLVGPVGVVIGGALTSNSFDVTGMAIHYFGMVVMVIAFFMAKDDYKELND